MRNTLGWMLLLSGTLLAGTAGATDPKGFKGVTLASGSFQDLNLWNHWFLPQSPPGREDHDRRLSVWFSHLRTRGTSDLYVQDNTWEAGGSTGWHTHPGAGLIIVTQGTVTAYEGDDPDCTPHVYTVGDTFVDSGGGHRAPHPERDLGAGEDRGRPARAPWSDAAHRCGGARNLAVLTPGGAREEHSRGPSGTG
ncbi:MAG TPA: hypothetical protein VGK85_09985 [Myxococcaceae bacterium]|jgi:hypothetical protein